MFSRALMAERFLASDATFDGRFITGVLTTGIYCRPSCTARKPHLENVRFFRSPEEARDAGLRACLRCHPDAGADDAGLALARGMMARLRRDPSQVPDVSALARLAGIGVTSLHELVRRHYHCTPAALLRRERIASATGMLMSGREAVIDVAQASGFESLSSFNANFRRSTGMTPGSYRTIENEFSIALPRDYLTRPVLRYMARDGESLTERGSTNGFAKALLLDGQPALLDVTLLPGEARCRVDGLRSRNALAAAHAAVLRVLGMPLDPAPFERRMLGDDVLAPLVASRRGLRVPQTATVFEALLWAIVGQQVNLEFAYKLRRVVIELAGATHGSMRAHPDAAAVARLDYADLTSRQFSRRKAEYVIDTARLVASGGSSERELVVEEFPRDSAVAVERALMAVRGFGPWSTNYVMMRGCQFADCVPLGDTGLTSSLQSFFGLEVRPDRDVTIALMEQFAPFRSLATLHLWMRLSETAM